MKDLDNGNWSRANKGDIKAIVFDLDGTLYLSEPFELELWKSVSRYAGHLLGISPEEGEKELKSLRKRLTEERGVAQTLAVTIQVMGGTVPEMHRRFAEELDPVKSITPDPRVRPLIEELRLLYPCLLLTNNNRVLTNRILAVLGLEDCFQKIITIDDNWRPKPDPEILEQLLAALGMPPEAVLFVGDRYDIDLRLPEQMGCPVLLIRRIDDLMQLEILITS